MKFNINHQVKVKLTDFGIRILKRKRRELNEMIYGNGGKGLGEYELTKDEYGYTNYQLWSLMSDFGEFMNMGTNLPFETEIIIVDKTDGR